LANSHRPVRSLFLLTLLGGLLALVLLAHASLPREEPGFSPIYTYSSPLARCLPSHRVSREFSDPSSSGPKGGGLRAPGFPLCGPILFARRTRSVEDTQVVGAHSEANPPFHPVGAAIPTPPEAMAARHDADPAFAAGPPAQTPLKPALTLLLVGAAPGLSFLEGIPPGASQKHSGTPGTGWVPCLRHRRDLGNRDPLTVEAEGEDWIPTQLFDAPRRLASSSCLPTVLKEMRSLSSGEQL